MGRVAEAEGEGAEQLADQLNLHRYLLNKKKAQYNSEFSFTMIFRRGVKRPFHITLSVSPSVVTVRSLIA